MRPILLLTSLISITTALPSHLVTSEDENSFVCLNDEKNANISESEEYSLLLHGKRIVGDYLFKASRSYLPIKEAGNTAKINAGTYYSRSITFVKFNYTSMEKGLKSSIKIIGGGRSYDWVEIDYSSESGYIYYEYEIYGMNNGYKTVAVSNIQDVKSEKDLEVKINEAGNKLVVLFFSAKWCPWSKLIEPKIEKLSLEYSDVVFLKVDYDNLKNVFYMYHVKGTPTFAFIQHGKEVGSKVAGGKSENEVDAAIKKYKDL